MTAVVSERLVSIDHPRLRTGAAWATGLGTEIATAGEVIDRLEVDAGFGELDVIGSFGVAVVLGRRGVVGVAPLGRDALSRLQAGSAAASANPGPYVATWASAVTVGALLRLAEVAAGQVARSAPDPLVVEQLGTVDSAAWAGVTACEALVDDVWPAIADGHEIDDATSLALTSRVSAIAHLMDWIRDDAIPVGAGVGREHDDPYLAAATLVTAAARTISTADIERRAGRHVLTGASIFATTDEEGPR